MPTLEKYIKQQKVVVMVIKKKFPNLSAVESLDMANEILALLEKIDANNG